MFALSCTGRGLPRRLVVTCSLLLLLPASVSAQSGKAPPFRQRIVDLLILNDGTRLFGTSLPEPPDSLLVRTEWLQKNANPFFEEWVLPRMKSETDEPNAPSLRTLVKQEVQRLQLSPEPDAIRIGMLKEFLQQHAAGQTALPHLICLQFPRTRIRRLEPQSDRNQQLGRLALLNQLPDPELLDWKEALQQLQAIPEDRRVLSFQPSRETSAEQQFQLLLAAVDLRTGQTVEFVSTGSRLIAQDRQIDIATLMSTMLHDQLQNQLSDLLGPEFGNPASPLSAPDGIPDFAQGLPAEAAAKAAQKQVRTAVISGFVLKPEEGSAAAWRVLFRQLPEGTWIGFFRHISQASVSDVSEVAVETIAEDPQVRQIQSIIGGLGGVSGVDLQHALKLGAAVRIANDRCNAAVQDGLAQVLKGQGATADASSVPVIRIPAAEVESNPAPQR